MGGFGCVLVLDIHIYFRDNNDEFGIDFENIMEEGAANGMNDDLDDDDAADDDDWKEIFLWATTVFVCMYTCEKN